MHGLREKLAHLINVHAVEDGYLASLVPGVRCMKMSQVGKPEKRRWRACLAILVQGRKDVWLEHGIYRCNAGEFTATPMDLPVVSRIGLASVAEPFLCLMIDLDPVVLTEISGLIDQQRPSPKTGEVPPKPILIGEVTAPLYEAAIRLVRTLSSVEEAAFLGPLYVREIFIPPLTGPAR